jgi:hypothetical protein
MRHRSGLAIVAALLIAGCADTTAPSDELRDAEQRWAAWGPASYDLTISPACECQLYPVVVYVRAGIVTSREYSGILGGPVPDGLVSHYPDVPGLFARIRSELAESHLGSVEYDALTGYPLRIVFDYDGPDINGADGETVYDMVLVAR